MNNVDPDIIHALRVLKVGGDAQRVLGLKPKHEARAEQQFQTQMELLSDEVERVVPRNHPMFELVLTLAVIRKLERSKQEPEFISDLEAGWPAGW